MAKSENLDESNVDEAIDKAIDHYFKIGFLVDGLFWSKAIAIYRDRVRKLGTGSSDGRAPA